MREDEAVRLLFDAPVQVAVMPPSDDESALWPRERELIRGAVARRRREFVAGRILARRLLRRLGAVERPLLCDAERRPLWPEGTTGSIAHSDTCCVVAVAAAGGVRALGSGVRAAHGAIRAIGIDVEERLPLDRGSWARVARPDEWRRLVRPGGPHRASGSADRVPAGWDDHDPGAWMTALFSIKECVFKCWSSATGRALDRRSISVTFDGGDRFRARILDRHAQVVATGRVRFTERHILAGAVLAAAAGGAS